MEKGILIGTASGVGRSQVHSSDFTIGDNQKFPLLMQVSAYTALIAFFFVGPVSVLLDIFGSFGVISDRKLLAQTRLLILGWSIIVLLLNLLVNLNHWFRNVSPSIYLIFFVYIFATIAFHGDEVAYRGDQLESASEYFTPIIFNYVAYFVIGLHLLLLKNFRLLILVTTLMSAVVVLMYVNYDTFRIDIDNYVEGARTGNYQSIGDSLAMSSLLLVALFSNRQFQFLTILASLFVLFLVGSRTSFAVYAFVSLLFIIMHSKIIWLIPVLFGIAISVVIYGGTIDWQELEARNPRMVRIFTDYDEDNSIQGRRERDESGWQDIVDSPITGKFGGQRAIGDWGGYMHNFFSYWRQFGIFPFLLLIIMYANFVFVTLTRYSSKESVNYRVAFLLGTYFLVASVISRSYGFGSTHVFFGLLIAFNAWNRYGAGTYMSGGRVHGRRVRRRKSTF